MFIKKLGQFKNNHSNTPVYDPTRVAAFLGHIHSGICVQECFECGVYTF